MNLNLFMAVFWALLGGGLVAVHWLYPEVQTLRLRGTELSPGWLILALAVWNLARWWNARSYENERRYEEEVAQKRQDLRYSTLKMSEKEVNPEFDFDRPAEEEKRDKPADEGQ